MDSQSGLALLHLVREQRTAALGTIFQGSPLVSMVLFSASPDLSGLDIHVSRLAQHTQGLLHSRNVGLMIAEADRESRNPQTLARLSLQGEAEILSPDHPAHSEARAHYLTKFPTAALNFELGDFLLVRIKPRSARLVTGFGKIFDLSGDDLKQLAIAEPEP
jgi:putative heme iron utilization protein